MCVSVIEVNENPLYEPEPVGSAYHVEGEESEDCSTQSIIALLGSYYDGLNDHQKYELYAFVEGIPNKRKFAEALMNEEGTSVGLPRPIRPRGARKKGEANDFENFL